MHDGKSPLNLVFFWIDFFVLSPRHMWMFLIFRVQIMPVYFITSVQVNVEYIYEFVGVPKDVMCLGLGEGHVYIHLITLIYLVFAKSVEKMLPKMSHLCGKFKRFQS